MIRHKVDRFEKFGSIFFEVAIQFHPGHLQPKTHIFTIRALIYMSTCFGDFLK